MIVVIQCAAKKSSSAGYLRSEDGEKVLFVAEPQGAPASVIVDYARPDDEVNDVADGDLTWRDHLTSYNAKPGGNPLELMPAWQLYSNRAYKNLVDRFGQDKLYILSAGWGMLAADFLTPMYDITFSASAEGYKRRRSRDRYSDLSMLPAETAETVVLFGGKDYVSLFCELTKDIKSARYIFYNSVSPPNAPGCELVRFNTTARTNWHYLCAQAFIEGRVSVG
jgi:hypothetical protein